jgi:hypothetical protein
MTARTVVATSSLVVALASAGCMNFYEIPVETPIQAKLDVGAFKRILVAGFLTGGSKAIDPNTETARLLRSQLRSKSDLRVIDADALVLADEFDKFRVAAGAAPIQPAGTEVKIKNDEDLKAYEQVFNEAAFWKKVAAEQEAPLIITGSIVFTEISKSGMTSRLQTIPNSQTGQVDYQENRQWSEMKGYALTPKFVFIDGRTGQPLYSESFHEETLYSATSNTPALSAYFELMDKLLPGFLNTLSSQKIKGTRILLK